MVTVAFCQRYYQRNDDDDDDLYQKSAKSTRPVVNIYNYVAKTAMASFVLAHRVERRENSTLLPQKHATDYKRLQRATHQLLQAI